ncbi:hypothetical protein [Nocardia sp. NPDC023988]|uniref:DUF7373 family lipoprotein n=1 Tax=unclassified Nocardia TaxID=2637762 RepID=UPI0033C457E8
MKRHAFVSAAIAAICMISGCGEDAAHSTTVDTGMLDSGNYPTSPRDVEAVRSPAAGAIRESVRIGEHSPIPFEYDHRFAYGPDYPRFQIITPQEPPYIDEFGLERADFHTEFPGFVAGWHNFATRRPQMNMGRIIDTYTLRFETPEQARGVAEKMSRLSAGETRTVQNYPGSYTKLTVGETSKLRTWLPHEDMVLYIRVTDHVSRPFVESDNLAIVERFFDTQIEGLRDYKRTPVGEVATQAIDIDGLLSRTLPADKPLTRHTIYPAHVALSLSRTPARTALAYTDAGVDLVVVADAFVYRTRDPEAAERLSSAFDDTAISPNQTPKADPPPGLPSAVCFTGDPDMNISPNCRFTVGRYVVRVPGTNLQDAHQRAAAQYRLLAE